MIFLELSSKLFPNQLLMTWWGRATEKSVINGIISKTDNIINLISMENQSAKTQILKEEAQQNSAQHFPDHFLGFSSFSLEESNCFQHKQGFQNYGYHGMEEDLSQVFPFLNFGNYLYLGGQLDLISPKTEEGQNFQPQIKKEHMLQQNLKSFQIKGEDQSKDYQACYHRGHIDFMRHLTTPIYLQSRKYWKSKGKRRGKTYYQYIAQHMRGQQSKSCKRYDQYHLQQFFKKMSFREQGQKQATLQALKHLKKYKENSENQRLLEKHEQKYNTCRKWGLFLDRFVNNQQ